VGTIKPFSTGEIPWSRRRPKAGFWPKRSDIVPAMVGLLLGVALFLNLGDSLGSHDAGVAARAIDGDTIEIVGTGERIRLPNIDTPETQDRAHCAAERAAGERAKYEMIGLIANAPVQLQRTGTDIYGRTLAYVRVDGKDVGQILIERGLARPWRGHREPWCNADGKLLSAS
jgi:endonuclease YncB( thermonuclease family)